MSTTQLDRSRSPTMPCILLVYIPIYRKIAASCTTRLARLAPARQLSMVVLTRQVNAAWQGGALRVCMAPRVCTSMLSGNKAAYLVQYEGAGKVIEHAQILCACCVYAGTEGIVVAKYTVLQC